jgi:hypothetical protein
MLARDGYYVLLPVNGRINAPEPRSSQHNIPLSTKVSCIALQAVSIRADGNRQALHLVGGLLSGVVRMVDNLGAEQRLGRDASSDHERRVYELISGPTVQQDAAWGGVLADTHVTPQHQQARLGCLTGSNIERHP